MEIFQVSVRQGGRRSTESNAYSLKALLTLFDPRENYRLKAIQLTENKLIISNSQYVRQIL